MSNDQLTTTPSRELTASRLDPDGTHVTLIGLSEYELAALSMKILLDNDGYYFGEQHAVVVTEVHEFQNESRLYGLTICVPSEKNGAPGNGAFLLGELDGVRSFGGSALDVSINIVSGFEDYLNMPMVDGSRTTKTPVTLPQERGLPPGQERVQRPIQPRFRALLIG